MSVWVASIFGFSRKPRHRKTVRPDTIDNEPIPFESHFSPIGDPVFLIEISADDLPGKIVEAKEAASEVYGYTPSEFRTLTLSNLLMETGCDAVQGFYFFRPFPSEEIARRISAQNATIRRSNARGRHE